MGEKIKELNPLGYKPVGKLLKSLAIPAIIANLVNALYNVVDQIFIGQGIGYLGNAATNIAFPITTMCLAIGLTLGIGGASNFNLELGKGYPEKSKHTAGTAASTLIIIGIILCITVRIFLEPLMIGFGATNKILEYSMEYTGITSYGIPFLLFSIGVNPLVRADGNAKYSMIAIVIGAILNTILDPLFMFVYNLGIAGAAWATVISQIISALLLLIYFPKFKSVKFSLNDFIPQLHYLKRIISLGFASFIYQFSNMIVLVTTNNLLKIYGKNSIYGSDIPIAVFGIVMKINVIFIAIVLGLVQGAQPIFGFNYGAKNYHRVRETMRLLLKVTFSIATILFIIFQVFPKQIISLFGEGDKLYFEFATKYMRIFLLFISLNSIQISIATFFPSIGKAIKGAIVSLTKQLIVLFPLLLTLPKFFGVEGVIYATPLTDLIAFTVAIIFLINEFKYMPKS
ncbi:MATE family efflux transporter [Fusobacterium polymorphum]|uniref:MATE family efflux transporter n=1 Tax=Fusobacterium nucleatum subsp. polymorphum TaxID=76857 RepID=UPI002B4C0BDD|nr:MATE family efflux transporter [Fusobacterium polymorphum]WRL77823.1 MATE family efflux transporter [Fusobacterium polymorphum]